MLTQEEIYRKVSATLVEALNVDEDEITPGATLQGDLGAEIDFLDIVFRLERDSSSRSHAANSSLSRSSRATRSSYRTAR